MRKSEAEARRKPKENNSREVAEVRRDSISPSHRKDKPFAVLSISKIVSAPVAVERVAEGEEGARGRTYFPVHGGFCVTKSTIKGGLHPFVSDRRL